MGINLGVLKQKLNKILKVTFNGSIINETGKPTIFLADGGHTLTGNKYNINSSSTCSLKITQQGGSDWFNLQRDFDLSFDLVVNTGSPGGEFITIEDSSEGSWFRMDYDNTGSGSFRILHGGSPNFTSLGSGAYAVPKDTTLNCKLEYRKTSAKLLVGGVTVINATGWLARTNLVRDLWIGGSGASNTIAGSLDNIEMTLL